jgi:hypothetical protein
MKKVFFAYAWMNAAIFCACDLAAAADVFVYRELCEASAAAALDSRHFIVASDETNRLRIYKRGDAKPVGEHKLAQFLNADPDKGSDLEGAARIGKRIYWISSHSRNKDGEVKEWRLRFFATDIRPGSPPSVEPVGQPYTKLLDDMVAAPALSSLGLADAIVRKPEDSKGFNIEGLAATPKGDLFIGLRNPVPDGTAILIRLKNPNGVINGKKARFGPPIRLNLNGRGIRSIDLVGSKYLIVAGPVANDGSFALYRWSGDSAKSPEPLTGIDLRTLHPEAMFAIPNTNQIQILSDDGGEQAPGINCKKGAPESEQAFRSITIAYP